MPVPRWGGPGLRPGRAGVGSGPRAAPRRERREGRRGPGAGAPGGARPPGPGPPGRARPRRGDVPRAPGRRAAPQRAPRGLSPAIRAGGRAGWPPRPRPRPPAPAPPAPSARAARPPVRERAGFGASGRRGCRGERYCWGYGRTEVSHPHFGGVRRVTLCGDPQGLFLPLRSAHGEGPHLSHSGCPRLPGSSVHVGRPPELGTHSPALGATRPRPATRVRAQVCTGTATLTCESAGATASPACVDLSGRVPVAHELDKRISLRAGQVGARCRGGGPGPAPHRGACPLPQTGLWRLGVGGNGEASEGGPRGASALEVPLDVCTPPRALPWL